MSSKKSFEKESLIECGRVGRAVGLRGECQVAWFSGECPVKVGGKVMLSKSSDGDECSEFTVAARRRHGRCFIVRFEGVKRREDAGRLTGRHVFVSTELLPRLSKGEYYCYQIIGMDVHTVEGEFLGRVEKIFTVGENDVYEIVGDKDGEEPLLIPAVRDFIVSINVADKKMVVRLIKGMRDE
jgi:16S rRNA processing protein RimM